MPAWSLNKSLGQSSIGTRARAVSRLPRRAARLLPDCFGSRRTGLAVAYAVSWHESAGPIALLLRRPPSRALGGWISGYSLARAKSLVLFGVDAMFFTRDSQPLEFDLSRTGTYVLVTGAMPWKPPASPRNSDRIGIPMLQTEYFQYHTLVRYRAAPLQASRTTVYLGLSHLAWPH